MATQLYFPPSDIFTLRICSVRPPADRQITIVCVCGGGGVLCLSLSLVLGVWGGGVFVFQLCVCVCVFRRVCVCVCLCVCVCIPGMISALVLASTGLLSLSQLREGGECV